MSDLQVFNFDDAQVRTVVRDGEPWFVAADVCFILNIGNPSMAVAKLDGDEVTLSTIEGSHRDTNIINESGLYSLIMTSRKPEAKRFKKWVTAEVLPAIRKTGSYQAPLTPELQMAHGLIAAQKLIEQKDATIAELTPKAAVADRLQGAEGNMNLRNAAKALKKKEHEFIRWLQLNGWVFRNKKGRLEGYSSKVPRFVDHKVTPIPVDGDEDRVSLQVMITPEGLVKLAALFNTSIENAA